MVLGETGTPRHSPKVAFVLRVYFPGWDASGIKRGLGAFGDSEFCLICVCLMSVFYVSGAPSPHALTVCHRQQDRTSVTAALGPTQSFPGCGLPPHLPRFPGDEKNLQGLRSLHLHSQMAVLSSKLLPGWRDTFSIGASHTVCGERAFEGISNPLQTGTYVKYIKNGLL